VNKSATLKFCLLVFSLQHNPDSYSIYKKTKKTKIKYNLAKRSALNCIECGVL